MGDPAAEELFWLAARASGTVEVLLLPCDLLHPPSAVKLPDKPDWLLNRYSDLTKTLRQLN